MFGSRTVTRHLARGAVAAALLMWAVRSAHTGVALVALIGAVAAMRGCPLCWTVGLVETIGSRFRAR